MSRPRPRRAPAAASVPSLDGLVITAAGVEAFDCPICETPRDLVLPECCDDHDDCPDRACAVCGFAVALGRDTGTGSPHRATAGRGRVA